MDDGILRTLIKCVGVGEDLLAQEKEYREALKIISNYQIVYGKLDLINAAGDMVLVYSKK